MKVTIIGFSSRIRGRGETNTAVGCIVTAVVALQESEAVRSVEE